VAEEQAILAGGCFWCTEAVFKDLIGVSAVESGYIGGHVAQPTYRQVCGGDTGHAEAIRVTFDPEAISYDDILDVHFATHDPTQLNRQGNDVGTQYRSAIFFVNDEQRRVAQAYIAQLTAAKAFPSPVVTQVSSLTAFYPAEGYHQNYLALHPTQPYIVYNDLPKLDALKAQFPDLYAAR